MPRRVVFRPQAEDEVLEAGQWYEAKRPGLGQEFRQALDVLVARIAESPLAFPRVHSESRRAVLSRFPYAVDFRVADDRSSCWRFMAGNIRLAGDFGRRPRPSPSGCLTPVAPDGAARALLISGHG